VKKTKQNKKNLDHFKEVMVHMWGENPPQPREKKKAVTSFPLTINPSPKKNNKQYRTTNLKG